APARAGAICFWLRSPRKTSHCSLRTSKTSCSSRARSCRSRGSASTRSIFPMTGSVSLLAVMRQGDAIETATIGYEGWVGSLAGLGMLRANTRVVVQVRGSASRIAASCSRKVAEDSEAVCRIVVRYGEMLLIQAQQTAACNALHPVEAQLSRSLLQAR